MKCLHEEDFAPYSADVTPHAESVACTLAPPSSTLKRTCSRLRVSGSNRILNMVALSFWPCLPGSYHADAAAPARRFARMDP